MLGRSAFCKIAKKIYIRWSEKTYSLFHIKLPNNVIFEYGSAWWCLTEECLEWIVNRLKDDSKLLHFFDNALTPDECIFQTLFMMSPFSDTAKDNLTFLEWSSNRNNPRILIKSDYDLICKSEKLFARKFDCTVDSDIIEMLLNS